MSAPLQRPEWPNDELTRLRQQAARQRAARSIAQADMADRLARSQAARRALLDRMEAAQAKGNPA